MYENKIFIAEKLYHTGNTKKETNEKDHTTHS